MIIEKYFDAFGSKDISTLETLLADDVTLDDPSLGMLRGKKAVLLATQAIFDLGHIHLEVVTQINEGMQSAVEFMLTITTKNSETQKINGVDIITYTEDVITSIKAFVTIIN